MSNRTHTQVTADKVRDRVEAIWRQVLPPSETQTPGTFFELDGDSIAAARIVARVEEEVGVPIDISVLFDDPDSSAFARFVADQWTTGT